MFLASYNPTQTPKFLYTELSTSATYTTESTEGIRGDNSTTFEGNEESQPTECPTPYPLIISVALAVAAAVLESVIIAVLSVCALKYRKLSKT